MCYGVCIDVGPGYHLAITKHPNCKVDDVTELIHTHAQSASLESWVGAELVYSLPFSHANSFPSLFKALKRRKTDLKIQDCSVTGTTMEDVFTRWLPITCRSIHASSARSKPPLLFKKMISEAIISFLNPILRQ